MSPPPVAARGDFSLTRLCPLRRFLYIWGIELKTHVNMNKFLFSLVLTLLSFPTYARAQNSQEELRTLVQRVDSLEHELSYLKLNYDLKTLNYDINMFANEVYANYIGIKLDLYIRNFDTRLGEVLRQNYKAYKEKQEAISRLIEITKQSFNLKILIYPYSEKELNVLKSGYDTIDTAYDTLKRAMNLLKIVVDAYNESL